MGADALLAALQALFAQFEAQEAQRQGGGGGPLAPVDPTPLREALAQLPGQQFGLGEWVACLGCKWVRVWVCRVRLQGVHAACRAMRLPAPPCPLCQASSCHPPLPACRRDERRCRGAALHLRKGAARVLVGCGWLHSR